MVLRLPIRVQAAPAPYWVTLSKMVEDVKKKKAEAEIEIFEDNLEMIRKDEIEELPSGSESEGGRRSCDLMTLFL